MPAPRKIATGILDVQLIGLPEVKKQLEGVPLLMDGVAKASLNLSSKIANKQRELRSALRLPAEAAKAAAAEAANAAQRAANQYLKHTTAAAMAGQLAFKTGDPGQARRADRLRRHADNDLREFRRQEQIRLENQDFAASNMAAIPGSEERYKQRQFRQSAVSKLKEFREGALGTEALEALDQESAALDRLEAKIDMADKANQRFMASERQRIALSREAIGLQELETTDPDEYNRRHREIAAQQVTSAEKWKDAIRNATTGAFDAQLMGLPDVRRQLTDLPLLMEGVASATLEMKAKISAAQADATEHARVLSQTATERGDPASAATHAQYAKSKSAQVETEFFLHSAKQRSEQFIEAATGRQTLEYLDKQERALQVEAQRLRTLGEEEAVINRMVDLEMQRIQLSRQAVELEAKRTMDPDAYRRDRGVMDVQAGFTGFIEQFTGADRRKELDSQEEAIDNFDKETEARKVYDAQKQQSIDLDDDAVAARRAYSYAFRESLKAERASLETITGLGNRYQQLHAAYAEMESQMQRGVPLTKQQAASYKTIPRQLEEIQSKMEAAARAGKGWNLALHESGENSRRANYRWQQLSFGAQDFIQVYGQTGLAGALHASANNMSMFVQTLDIASPKLLAMAAFGVTAGMLAFGAWIKNTKTDTKELADSIARVAELQGNRVSRRVMAEKAAKDGAASVSEQATSARDRAAELQAQADSLRGQYVNLQDESIDSFWNSFWERSTNEATLEGRRAMIEGDPAALQAARDKFNETWNVETLLKEQFSRASYEDLFSGRVGEDAFDAIEKSLIDHGRTQEQAKGEVDKYRQVLQQLNQALADKAALEDKAREQARDFLDRQFEGTSDQFKRATRDIDLQEGLPSTKRAIKTEQFLGVQLGGMTVAEKANNDYRGAIKRLTSELSSLMALAKQEGVDRRALLKKYPELQAEIDSVAKSYRQHQNSLADLNSRIAGLGETGLAKIRREHSDRLRNDLFSLEESDEYKSMTPQQQAGARSAIRAQSRKDQADAEKQFTDSLEDAAHRQLYWNDQFALKSKDLNDAYTEYEKKVRESSLPVAVQNRLLQDYRDGQQSERQSLANQKALDTLDARGLGMFGGESNETQAMIDLDRQTLGVLQSIANDSNLSEAEKEEQKKLAFMSRRESRESIRDRFSKIGLTDPKSLHKQIQLSLQKTKSEAFLEKQVEYSKQISETLDRIEQKSGLAIGP